VDILLIGPPNVGKSVLFNRLTGLDVGMANYPGTTVDYKKGKASVDDKEYQLIDVPGTYTLDASNQAEQIAVDMLKDEPGGVVCVLDAKNLESSLYLLLQVLEYDLPTVAVINRVDLIEERLDLDYLSKTLDIPVITTIATKDKGINKLKELITDLIDEDIKKSKKQVEAGWEIAEKLEKKVKKEKFEREKSKRERWGELLVKPFPGIPLAILILGFMFLLVVGAGMAMRQYFFLPLFELFVFPPIVSVVEYFTAEGTLRDILVGEYGFLIKAIEWPLGLVLPYIISFYTALSILEDSGYMPRLAVLLDGILNKMGLSGAAIIPLLLGYGCAIPSILSTRTMEDKKKRMIVSTMVCLSVPCVAQSGAFIALLAERSVTLVLVLFLFSLTAAFLSGLFLSKIFKVKKTPMIQEVPDLLLPDWRMFGKKLWIRVKHFLTNGAIPMIYIIGAASILYETGVLAYVGVFLEPLVTGWLGLPSEASTPLILGIFRRELAVLPLLEMELSNLQLFVGAVIALFYVPCVAVLGVLAKEYGAKVSAGVLAFTIIFSMFIGGVIAHIGGLIL